MILGFGASGASAYGEFFGEAFGGFDFATEPFVFS